MTHYEPQQVLPDFTDEALQAGTVWGRAEAGKLLTIPAEYRQAAEAEVVRRTNRFDRSDGDKLVIVTGDACQARTEVVAEVAAQLRAEAPDA